MSFHLQITSDTFLFVEVNCFIILKVGKIGVKSLFSDDQKITSFLSNEQHSAILKAATQCSARKSKRNQ